MYFNQSYDLSDRNDFSYLCEEKNKL